MSHYKSFKRNISFSLRLEYGLYQFCDHFFGRKKIFRSRASFYRRLENHMKKFGEGKIMEVERRKQLSASEFKNHYLRKGIPVILEGAAKDWSCVKNWSLDYFKEKHGKDEVVIVDQELSDYPYELTTLRKIIDNIQAGGDKYYRFYPLLHRHPEHLNDLDYEWLKQRNKKFKWFDAFQVFIGGKDTSTSLHNANPSNLFVQVSGEKKWMLYSHYYTAIVDPDPVRNIYRNAPNKIESGSFDPFENKTEGAYRLYKYIDGYSVHLKPGDILWNPPFYWHAVKNESESIGVGYRWFSPLYSFKISPLYMLLDFFSTKPPIWKSYKLYKKDMNELHLAEVKKLEEAKQKIKEHNRNKQMI